MDKPAGIARYFSGVETAKELNDYFCNAGEALTIVILDALRGLAIG